MSTLKIAELATAITLDAKDMTAVRGVLNAVIDNSQLANQAIAGGYGPIFAVNSPISAPMTRRMESNPYTSVNLSQVGLVSSTQNSILPAGGWPFN